jgi:Cation transporter/ATPase, N-terminus
MKIHQLSAADAIASLNSNPQGLSSVEAQRRLGEYGLNRVEEVARESVGPSVKEEVNHAENILLAGTSMVSGQAQGVVFATGMHTEFGKNRSSDADRPRRGLSAAGADRVLKSFDRHSRGGDLTDFFCDQPLPGCSLLGRFHLRHRHHRSDGARGTSAYVDAGAVHAGNHLRPCRRGPEKADRRRAEAKRTGSGGHRRPSFCEVLAPDDAGRLSAGSTRHCLSTLPPIILPCGSLLSASLVRAIPDFRRVAPISGRSTRRDLAAESRCRSRTTWPRVSFSSQDAAPPPQARSGRRRPA